ncbi:hypothetical protein BKA70DRAFT_688530 [Coprinopsis sp. MPI-PUGE-AT-0042]|nr:hypothetical protein BKA70DRAFT_688530 [Coprinopsis sp. MPI-PUGE-AT-0042]
MGPNSAKVKILHAATSGANKRTLRLQDGVEEYTFWLDDTFTVSIASLPAFENDDVEKNLEVCKILFNFFHRLRRNKCNNVVMAYDLSMLRLRHCDYFNFRLVADLCGPHYVRNNLTIITTNWNSETLAEVAHLENRESDLLSRGKCFKDFLERGARYYRHDSLGSPPTVTLLRTLAAQHPVPLAIQEEVTANLTFNKTKIGEVMTQRLRDHLKMVSERSQSLKTELAEASKDDWDRFTDYEVDAMARDQEALEQTWVRLSGLVEDL